MLSQIQIVEQKLNIILLFFKFVKKKTDRKLLKFSFNFGGMRIFVVSCCLRKKQRYRKSENDNIWVKQERTVRYTPKHVQRQPSIREKLLGERYP